MPAKTPYPRRKVALLVLPTSRTSPDEPVTAEVPGGTGLAGEPTALARLSWPNLLAGLKAYFDTAYNTAAIALHLATTGTPHVTAAEKATWNGRESGTITRDEDGLVTAMEIGAREITINRDEDDVITGWEDATHEWTLTRDGSGNITEWEVSAK